jgi:hypothetical protein
VILAGEGHDAIGSPAVWARGLEHVLDHIALHQE